MGRLTTSIAASTLQMYDPMKWESRLVGALSAVEFASSGWRLVYASSWIVRQTIVSRRDMK